LLVCHFIFLSYVVFVYFWLSYIEKLMMNEGHFQVSFSENFEINFIY
jgi:hypothetical protein